MPKVNIKKKAASNLKKLSNKTHLVITSVTLLYLKRFLSGIQKTYLFRLISKFPENYITPVIKYKYTPISFQSQHYENLQFINVNIIDVSEVVFNKLTEIQILNYINTFKPYDKAGSYGIQDDFPLVKKLNGSMSNVVGLPLGKLMPFLMISNLS